MIQFETKYFGTIASDQVDLLHFPFGLPAFEDEKRFIPLDIPDRRPLVFLQSAGRRELCFVACPVLVVNPQYQLWVSPEDLALLDLPLDRQPSPLDEVIALAILSIPKDEADGPITANLLAPLVINPRTHRAVQAIRCDSEYSHCQPVPGGEDEC
jgi:flagellar assembly factor FliW